MPETACLHIQARDSDPIRVVELPGSSVRIGRASYCEVRLTEPDLADEECRLRLRGGIWQLVPSRAAGFVWIDGRSVEATCPLPFDVPFRVGEHWLTLRPTGAASPEWRAYKTPAPTTSTIAREEVRPPAADPRGRDDSTDLFEFTTPPPRPAPTPDYDQVSRWKERETKRSKRSDVSPEERRWENRWRAAGERVRARPPVVAAPIPPPTPPTTPPIAATPPDDLAFRRPPLDPAELRNRGRRGTAPVDRRASIAEVPTPILPVAPLSAPLIEVVAPQAPAYHAPRLPRVDLPPLEARTDIAPRSDWDLDPGVAIPEIPPARTLLADPPAPAFAEPIEERGIVADRLAPAPEVEPEVEQFHTDDSPPEVVAEPIEESGVVTDRLADSPEGDQPRTEESPPQALIDAPAAYQAEVPPCDEIDPLPVATEDEAQAVAPEFVESKVLTEARDDLRWDAEAIAPPAAAGLIEPAAISDQPVLDEAHVDAAGPAEVRTNPLTAELTEAALAVEEQVAAETEGEAGPIATPSPSPATLAEPIESPGFVADACLADPDKRILDQPNLDLTTTVHDACGLPRTPRTADSGPSNDEDHLEVPPTAARQQLGTPPLADWEVPFETSARSGSGSKPQETTPPPSSSSSRDWPTVRDILASHNAGVRRATAPRPTVRPIRAQPILTESREPAHWTFPLWLGLPPALIAVFAIGIVGVALTCIWSSDARWSGSVAALLAGGGATVKPLPESVPTPKGSWWRSSAANLMLWSIYFDRRPADDPLNAEQANQLLVAASQASPIQAQVRFALARRAPVGDESSSFHPSLGLSQDIEAQTWLGHQWVQRGNKEVAIKVYRRALEMAARVDLSRVVAPVFDEDTQILRYDLPGEELTGRVIRDMADHQTKWTFAEWKEALPPFAPIYLAAARLLRERGSADAEAALDLILTQLDAPRLEGSSASLHLAAQAEAFAFKSQWKEAKTRYQEALEQMPIDAIKRSWWMNLAEIERRLNDDSSRLAALELAKGNNTNDEISQRAVDLMRFSGTRPEKVRAQH